MHSSTLLRRARIRQWLCGLLAWHALAVGAQAPAPLPAAAATLLNDTSWPMYNLNYASSRYVDLDQINVRNIARLDEVCRVRVDVAGAFQSGLLLADGLLYLTTRTATVALDPTDCSIVWKSLYAPEQKEPFGVNRGPAYADGRVFRGTTDCRLLALSGKTGALLWKVKPCDPEAGEWLAAAPIVWNGMLFIGIAGGDWGVRGRLFAFDAGTGRELWRFNTVPAKGEFGADTWKGESALTGGGATWTSYTLDPEAAELFVSVGNPGADFDKETRAGANLFTNSLVVLDANSGRLKWWYQIRPHDDKDLDLGAAAMLYTRNDGRRAIALGSKDGHLYLLDRDSHKLLSTTPVTTILNQDQPVTVQGGLRTCPSVVGGVEWNGPALDRAHRAIVVGAVDWCTVVKKSAKPEYQRGEMFLGGTFEFVRDPPPSGWITSVDQDSGRVRWHFHAEAPVVSGITPTAGGVTFAGDMSGNLYGFDSDSGTVLFKRDTGGAIAGGVITYQVAQRQFVAVTSGNVSRLVWGATGLPSVVIYGIRPPASDGAQAAGGGQPLATSAGADAAHGREVYARVCSACHGASGEGATGPSLKDVGKRLSVEEIAAWIMNPIQRGDSANAAAMPKLYPSVLTERDVLDVAASVGAR